MKVRTCQGSKDGAACRAAPLRESAYCLWHDPEHAEAAQEARRLGGQRRRRERVVAGVYDFEGLDSVPKIQRLVEVAVLDTLGLENSVARNRTLGSLATTAVGLLEKSDFEERLEALERVAESRRQADKGGKR